MNNIICIICIPLFQLVDCNVIKGLTSIKMGQSSDWCPVHKVLFYISGPEIDPLIEVSLFHLILIML